MKIALFTETYLPYINGVVTHVKALRDGLESLGHEVLVVTVDINARRHYIRNGVLYCPAAELKKLYHFGLASPLSVKRLKLLSEFHPDVIHVHQEFGIGLSGFRIAKKLKVPLVYTMHTMYDDYLYYLAPKKMEKVFVPLLRRIAHRYFKALGKQATELTGPSQKVQEYFDECGLQKSVNVVPNPVELDLFSPSAIDPAKSAEIRRRYGVGEDDTLVCFCGRLGQEKNVDTLLKNWAQNVKPSDRLKLIILGGGPALEELQALTAALGIQDMVLFTGMLEHGELPAYYGACQLYITASLSDTNSISMKEGMATGLPVIHIHDPLNAGQVVDGVNGFIYRDADEMYRILKQYQAMSPEEKGNLKRSVINSVKSFSSVALAEYLVAVYEKAILEKRASLAEKRRR